MISEQVDAHPLAPCRGCGAARAPFLHQPDWSRPRYYVACRACGRTGPTCSQPHDAAAGWNRDGEDRAPRPRKPRRSSRAVGQPGSRKSPRRCRLSGGSP